MANIQDIRDEYIPQLSYQFEVELLGNALTGSGNAVQILTQRVQNANIPETAVGTIPVNFKDRQINYAGRDESGHTTTITFFEDQQHRVYTFFKDWMENGISNSTTGGGLTKDLYSIEMRIRQYESDGETLTGTHRLTHVYPTNIGEISLSYDASETMTIDITFSFDQNLHTPA